MSLSKGATDRKPSDRFQRFPGPLDARPRAGGGVSFFYSTEAPPPGRGIAGPPVDLTLTPAGRTPEHDGRGQPLPRTRICRTCSISTPVPTITLYCHTKDMYWVQ